MKDCGAAVSSQNTLPMPCASLKVSRSASLRLAKMALGKPRGPRLHKSYRQGRDMASIIFLSRRVGRLPIPVI